MRSSKNYRYHIISLYHIREYACEYRVSYFVPGGGHTTVLFFFLINQILSDGNLFFSLVG